MKRVIFLIFTLLVGTLSEAQTKLTQTIRGNVMDGISEMPLTGATVVLMGTNPPIGVITDENGIFRLEQVPLGRQSVQISFVGYNPSTVSNLIVNSGKEIVLTVKLQEKVIETEEIVIKAQGRKDLAINQMAMISARSFSVEETEKYAGSLGDPSRMVANFAGVMSVSDQRNDIVIRGNSPIGVLWRLDGMEIPNPNHFGAMGTTGGPVSMLNNNLLSNSDFFTGAFPAEYGNATSGAFDLQMRNGNNEKREYIGQCGFNGFELGAEGPFSKKSKASYLGNFRYSTLEVLDKLGFDFGTGMAVPQYKDLSFKLNFPGHKQKLSIFGIAGSSFIFFENNKSEDDATYGTGGSNLRFGSDMAVVGASHQYFINENTRIKTNLCISGWKSTTQIDTFNRTHPDDLWRTYGGNYTEYKYTLSSNFIKKMNTKNNFSAGATLDLFQLNLKDSFYVSRLKRYFPNAKEEGNMGLFQAYAQLQHRFTDQVTLYWGLHYQHFLLNSSKALEPRLSLKWNFRPNQSFTLGFGMHSQLQPHTIYFHQTIVDSTLNITTQLNKKVDFTRSNHLVIGYDFLLANNIRFKLETYYQQLYDIPVVRESPQWSMANTGADFYIEQKDSLLNQGTGTNYGIELTLEKFYGQGYYFLITTSLFDSKYKGYDKIERNTVFNGNFVVNALLGYEFKIGEKSTLAFNAKTVWAGGKRRLPVNLVASRLSGGTEYDWDNAYKQRYDDYFKIDGRLSFRLNGKRINQEWALDIQNITNNKNILVEQYDNSKNKTYYEYQTGFYPMMLYRIQF